MELTTSPKNLGDLMLNWYQKQLGSRAELSRPGEDEYSVYVHIDDFEGGSEVLAVFLVPESIKQFMETIKNEIKYLEEKEIFVDYIDVWAPHDWVDKLEEVVDELNEETGGSPIIRIRDSTQLSIPISAIEEIVSRSKPPEVSSFKSKIQKRMESRFKEDKRPALKKETGASLTEERLEEILERVIRKVEGERRINNVERTVNELQRRISLLEEVIKLLISSRSSQTQPPLDSSLVLSEQKSVEKKVIKKPAKLEPGVRRIAPKPQPREFSPELIEEFVKDNPWAEVLKERGKREEDEETTS